MTFEFLISCQMMAYSDIDDIAQFLGDTLREILDYHQIYFDDGMIEMRHKRLVSEASAGNGNTLIGFAVELPNDTAGVENVIADFAKDLQYSPPVFHIVKFEDPLLQADLAERAAEIFVLEMKLRRVLSFMYLAAYQLRDPFDLLGEEQVEIPQRERPTEEQMKESSENQFFHITFSQYVHLNKRKQSDLMNMIRDSERYDVLRRELMRSPIEDEQDADLLNDLKELMDPIERMRNCVAHNRRPSTRLRQNYFRTRPDLEKRLDGYLADLRWSDSQDRRVS